MSPNDRPLTTTLRFTDPSAHLVDAEVHVPRSDPGTPVELWMPVWTPGSYLIREFARHLQDLSVQDAEGNPVPWRKTRKNTWEIGPGGTGDLKATYRIYGRELTVRTNWIESECALLNGAATFLAVRGREAEPHRIRIEIPRRWAGVWTALAGGETDTPAENPYRAFTFTAGDLDEVVDSPILAGSPAVHPFEVDGIPIALVNLGEGGLWDGNRAAADTRKIVERARDIYGSLPFDRYLFLNCITESRGGLEHKRSCVMMTSRYAFRRRKSYTDWLGLVSHEFFHSWNVKRSRPEALGPFDYEEEAYTRSLWVAEGVTSYYTDLIPRRAGLLDAPEYLEKLGTLVSSVQNTPGRFHQSLEEASLDAWIKLYRRDENTQNTTMSYYQKGAVVAWLLDAALRRATGGERSLDDLMRALFEKYSGPRGFADRDVQTEAEALAGTSLETFFSGYVRGRDELDYGPALATFGLRFLPADEDPGPDPATVWLGIETGDSNGRLVVQRVREGAPAREAGLNVDDEILALGGYRVRADGLTERLKQYRPGDRVELLVARREAIRILPVTLGPPPGLPWRLAPDTEAPPEAVAERTRWMGPAE